MLSPYFPAADFSQCLVTRIPCLAARFSHKGSLLFCHVTQNYYNKAKNQIDSTHSVQEDIPLIRVLQPIHLFSESSLHIDE